MPSGTAMPEQGGYRVQGRWRYSSGCEHCDWAFLGATIGGAAGGYADRCLFLIPRKDYEIIDTWNVSGLKGTGSHDIAVKDAFVPAHRMIRYSDNFKGVAPGLAVNTGPLYRLPWGQVFFRGVATASIGALQGMLDIFLEYGKSRVNRMFGTKAFDDPLVQMTCAEVAVGLDEMKTILHRNLRILEDYAARGEMPSYAGAHPLQVSFGDRGGALHRACHQAVPRGRRRRHLCRPAVRPHPRRHHRGAAARLEPVRDDRAQLRRGDVRRARDQGFLAVASIDLHLCKEWK